MNLWLKSGSGPLSRTVTLVIDNKKPALVIDNKKPALVIDNKKPGGP